MLLRARAVPDALTVGLAVGGGTGPEIAAVFEDTLRALAAARGAAVNLHVCPRRYATYGSMPAHAVPAADVARRAAEDAVAYENFLLELAGRGCGVLFRTAFNAESIYLVRERLLGVKVEPLPFAGGEFLLIRDEAQGFYGGGNNPPGASADVISRTCEFRRETTERILGFALAAAAQRWGSAAIGRIIMVYKFHLLDNRFARWVAEYAQARDLRIDLVQPDTMNRHLLRGGLRGNVLVVAANEWLDIMHADLLARYGGFVQEERFTRNVYLDARLRGLVEYQTVHGSADDIAGRGTVNPIATMRAAADVLERHGERAGVAARLEEAVAEAKSLAYETPDQGGSQGTLSVMRCVLESCRAVEA